MSTSLLCLPRLSKHWPSLHVLPIPEWIGMNGRRLFPFVDNVAPAEPCKSDSRHPFPGRPGLPGAKQYIADNLTHGTLFLTNAQEASVFVHISQLMPSNFRPCSMKKAYWVFWLRFLVGGRCEFLHACVCWQLWCLPTFPQVQFVLLQA